MGAGMELRKATEKTLFEQDIEMVIQALENGKMLDIAWLEFKSGYASGFILAIATYEATKRLLEKHNKEVA